LKDRELVTKGKNLCVEGGTGLKGGGDQSEECDENSVHGGSEHDLHKDHNPAFPARTEFSEITGWLGACAE